MNRQKLIKAGATFLLGAVVSLGLYIPFYEAAQPQKALENARVTRVQYYRYREIWACSGYNVSVEGENSPIDFPDNSWDTRIKEGEIVRKLVVRKRFPLFGQQLAGLEVLK